MTDKAKILVVDDEPQIVSILKEFLSLKGFSVTGALSAEIALEILAKENFDCVLLDIMMPGMKGNEAAKIIKNKYPSVKIIILTGFSNLAEALSREKISDRVFKKPFSLQELSDKLSELIELKQEVPPTVQQKGKLQARILVIKAKLLFVEPSQEVFKIARDYFKGLSAEGKEYDLSIASGDSAIRERIASFNPDLFVVNASQFKECSQILAKETIIYNAPDLKKFQSTELEKLAKSVETSCLKKGLIEIRWVEI